MIKGGDGSAVIQPGEMIPAPRNKRREIATSTIILVGSFALFAIFPSRNYNYADDSLRWAYELTQHENLINSHHLFLNAIRWIFQMYLVVDPSVNPAALLSIYAALLGATGLAFLHLLMRNAGFGSMALLGTLFCAFSAGYWSYSIVGDVYAPSFALMIIAIFCMYMGLKSVANRRVYAFAVGAVIAFTLMLLHHQALFIFVPGMVPAAFFMRQVSRTARWVVGIGVPALVAVVTLGIYAGVYGSLPRRNKGFLRFCAGYVDSFSGRPDQKQLGIGTIVNTLAGETRALISTNVLFRNSSVAEAIQHRYPSRAIYPFPYLVQGLPVWIALVLGVLAAVAVIALAFMVISGLRSGLKERDLILLIFVPVIPQILFFAWWEGISDEFLLWTIPIISIIAARGALDKVHGIRWASAVAGCLAISTFGGSIFLYLNPRNDVDFVNDQYVMSLSSGDLLIGFEDIQSRHRIMLEAQKKHFDYVDIRWMAERWSSGEDARLNAAVSSTLRRGARIYVSPRLTFPPISELAAVRFVNPAFDAEREAILAKLRTFPGVRWPKPAVFLKGYFLG